MCLTGLDMASDDSPSGTERRKAATCGEVIDIAQADGVRISRCSCGVIHLHVNSSGITLRLAADRFTTLAEAVAVAHRRLADDGGGEGESRVPPIH